MAAPTAPPSAPPTIRHLAAHAGGSVVVRGWLENKRSSGKIAFLQVRDGSGTVQAVASRAELSEAEWEAIQRATQESTVEVAGTVKADARAPGGVELQVAGFSLLHLTEAYPITPKEHGTAFLMEHRHLWLRSKRQRAALAVRSEVEQGIHDFFHSRDYVRGMWLMLQQDKPDDFVISTGETHTVREFADRAFDAAGLDYQDHVVVDPQFYRPAEVDILLGDASKARQKLGWHPTVGFDELIDEMVRRDLELAERERDGNMRWQRIDR